MQNTKAFLDSLTTQPGVYQMLGENGKILYVGKARNLKKRLASYFFKKNQPVKTQALIKHIQDIQIIITHSEAEALLLECNLIKKYNPHYNVLFRDDKSYPYILIKNEHPYPCLAFYRGKRKKDGYYFGPFPSAASVRESLHLLQKLFGLRTCHDRYYPNRSRPCLQYQIDLCSGACAGLISETDYQNDLQHAILFLQGKNEEVITELNDKMQAASAHQHYESAGRYRDQIAKIRDIQAKQYINTKAGNADVIGLVLKEKSCIQLLMIRGGRMLGSRAYFPTAPVNAASEEILSSFIAQYYLDEKQEPDLIPKEIIVPFLLDERALLIKALSEKSRHKVNILHSVRHDRKKWLAIANTSAEQSVASFLLKKANMNERFQSLQKVLRLEQPIHRMECFDVSHIMGEATVASCVVFEEMGPLKSHYRRFNIKEVTPGDDIAAMQQVISRRYKRAQAEKTTLPDIILIDGGKAQLKAAKTALAALGITSPLLLGVAKGEGRKPGLETLYDQAGRAFQLDAHSLALHLIQHIRDEAHRFAIGGHRLKRDKKRRTSSLQSIPGIGAKRRHELLNYFGGIQAINRASLDELAKVPGISFCLAKRIFAALHEALI